MKIGKSFTIQFLAVVAMLLSTLSCSKQRLLSDEELAVIFHDAFLSNAYTVNHRLNLDSLRLYEPIFQKYGYTTADVQHTIGSFANRKSARLSDVVERAIEMLEKRGDELDLEVAILDTINNIALRRTIRTIYEDSLITMRSIRDTSKFIMRLKNLELGDYELHFDYLIDSMDNTVGNYLSRNWVEDMDEELGKSKSHRRIRQRNAILTRKSISHFRSDFSIHEPSEEVVLALAIPSQNKGIPHLTIKRLKVNRVLSNSQARDSLFRQLCTAKIFDDELLFK